MKIDLNFNFYTDSGGRDPDLFSPTLKEYHRFLWSKELPNGKVFDLNPLNGYLTHESTLGKFIVGSDAITNSYRHHKRKQWLIKEVRSECDHLFDSCCNISSYIIFPKNKINNQQSINQYRGINRFIDDRFDLTLECIRRFYLGQKSPLFDTLSRYSSFFELFVNFEGYVNFFFLQDLLTKDGLVNFFLDFDDFKKWEFKCKDDYIYYSDKVIQFTKGRLQRIKNSEC